MRFRDRADAGQALAARLQSYTNDPDTIVLALPRGGVPVGYEVARALNAPLDVVLVRKLGVPGHAELAMGAIATGGLRALNHDVIDELGIDMSVVDQVTASEQVELARRETLYRGDRPAPTLQHRTVILVDDGLATGSTMEAAVQSIRQSGASRVIVAAPVGAPETCNRLKKLADDVECVMTPQYFDAVGLWYDRFEQTTDDEVIELLRFQPRQ